MSDIENAYEVGYGKPPKDTQFKPGKSGNPAGRPPGSKNIRAMVREALRREVAVTVDGRKTRLPLREAYVQRLIAKGTQGSMKDMKEFLTIVKTYFPEALDPPPEKPQPMIIELVTADGKVEREVTYRHRK